MKKFEIKTKGTITEFIAQNNIRVKGEILKADEPYDPTLSCFGVFDFVAPKKELKLTF